MMTREELERLEQLEKKVSAPIWEYKHGNDGDHWELWSKSLYKGHENYVWEVQDDSGVEPSTEFLEFITQSRNALPSLLKMAKLALEARDALETYATLGNWQNGVLAREWLAKFEENKN